MENREELFYKMPFYMTYPMQNLYVMEMEYEKDMERMKELYPKEVRHLQEMVEKRCNAMEYEGSRMYDENPDRRMMEKEIEDLYENFLNENPQYQDTQGTVPRNGQEEILFSQSRREGGWLRSLIGILFHDEIYRRRCRYRRCSRWW